MTDESPMLCACGWVSESDTPHRHGAEARLRAHLVLKATKDFPLAHVEVRYPFSPIGRLWTALELLPCDRKGCGDPRWMHPAGSYCLAPDCTCAAYLKLAEPPLWSSP